MSEPQSGAAAADAGSAGHGPRRVLVAVYAIFALAATARGVVQLTTQLDKAPLAYALSLFSGLVYIAATVGLLSQRPRSRRLAWAACSIELAGVLIVGFLSIADSQAFPKDTVWSRFGSGYGYIPLVLPLIGLFYLYRTRPSAAPRTPRSAPPSA